MDLSKFEPINSSEKVDAIYDYMNENAVQMTSELEMEIMLLIHKVKVQMYFKDKFKDYKVEQTPVKPPQTYYYREITDVARAVTKRTTRLKMMKDKKEKDKKKESNTLTYTPKSKKKETPRQEVSYLSKIEKGRKDAEKLKRERYNPTGRSMSINAISIPMGGQNKKY